MERDQSETGCNCFGINGVELFVREMALVHAEKTRKPNSQPSLSRGGGGNTLFFQPKLNIGKPHDQYEAEADKVADQVVSKSPLTDQPFFAPSASPPVQSIHTAPVQKNPVAESSTPLSQKEGAEDEMLQMQPLSEEESMLQAKSDSTPQVPADFESGLNRSKGGGSPLSPGVKNQMESGFDTDFSNVRIHTDSGAEQMSRQISAQAFTHGNDIYFNEGKYNPASKSGQHLIAHELTHTVQQATSVQPKMIQREEDDPVTEFNLSDGTIINADSKQMVLPMISLPQFKGRNADRFPLNMQLRQGERPKTQQIQFWKNEMRPSVVSGTNTILNQARTTFNYGLGDNVIFFLKPKNGAPLRIFGNSTTLIETFLIPFWNRDAMPTTFQVDHIYEDQMGGYDDIYNYELLDSTANGSAGPTIAAEIRSRIKQAIEGIKADSVQASSFNIQFTYGTSKTELTRVKNDYEITFTEREFTKPVNGHPDYFWDILSFIENQHINMLQVMSPAEIESEGLSGSNPERLQVFPGGSGGVPFEIPWGANQPSNIYIPLASSGINLFSESRLKLIGAQYNPTGVLSGDSVGFLRVQAFASDETSLVYVDGNSTFDWSLDPIPGLEFGGTINRESVAGTIRNSLRLAGLSPIELTESGLHPTKGIMALGKVLPTVPVISNADIDIVIEGDSIRLRKLINTGEFDIPSPFAISDSSLEIFVGNEGIGVEGNINFDIEQVGEGHIGAAASTSGGFELEGAFNFDSELFDPAEINVEYKENIWTIGGTIGIPEGKVRGVKSATITATYSENIFTVSGEAELDIPGIQRGTMDIIYGEEGFSISGNFDLKDDIPGIRSGNVSATVSKQAGEESYSVRVSGTAQPDIPGIDSTLTVSYDNGTLTIEGSAAYNRGMLAGTVNIGATNRSIGEDGAPAGDPDDTMRVYGGGSLTLTLTPWLQATAGVQFLPNSEIEVTGRIGLPDTVDVFDRKSIDRNLFTAPIIEIPIFAIPLGPRSIGIVARITGGLDFSAGFGPGQLRSLYADVTYNPDHEEETTISGHGEFVIPADAGLTLRGDLGLGVSVGIASLTGGIEIAGELGLEGEAAAGVDVNWSPQTGLALDAIGSITVQPKFVFDINAFTRASLDLLITSISETWRYNLVSFSWGPDIQFGIIFPIHYLEGEPFDMSFDDIEVIYPDLDIIEMAKGLARDIKDNIFD